MLKIRDLGVNIIPAAQETAIPMYLDTTMTCIDGTCGGKKKDKDKDDKDSKKGKKKPSKKKPSKKKKTKKTSGFSDDAIAQLRMQLRRELDH